MLPYIPCLTLVDERVPKDIDGSDWDVPFVLYPKSFRWAAAEMKFVRARESIIS